MPPEYTYGVLKRNLDERCLEITTLTIRREWYYYFWILLLICRCYWWTKASDFKSYPFWTSQRGTFWDASLSFYRHIWRASLLIYAWSAWPHRGCVFRIGKNLIPLHLIYLALIHYTATTLEGRHDIPNVMTHSRSQHSILLPSEYVRWCSSIHLRRLQRLTMIWWVRYHRNPCQDDKQSEGRPQRAVFRSCVGFII